MKKQIAAVVLAIVIGFPLSGCDRGNSRQSAGENSPAAAQSVELKVESTELATVPEGWDKDTLSFSDQGDSYAFVVRTAGGDLVVRDGKQGRMFSKCGSVIFAPKTADLFYWAAERDGSHARIDLVNNDTVIPTEYVAEGWLLFSRDGKRWLTVGGTQSGPGEGGQVVIMCDGKEFSRHSDASIPQFSADGEHVSYLVKDSGGVALHVDGKEVRTYKEPELKCSSAFNAFLIGPNMNNSFFTKYLSDGRLLVLSYSPKGWTVYRDNDPLAVYLHNVWGGGGLQTITYKDFNNTQSIVPWSVTVAENAPVSLWWEREAGQQEQWRIVRDGKPVDTVICNWFWGSQRPVISDNGLHWGYVARTVTPPSTNEEIHAVVDGRLFGPYGNVWGLSFSTAGKRFAYAASELSGEKDKDTWSFFVDGTPVPLKYRSVWPPVFSSDGNHVAWKATRENKAVVALDGKEIAVEAALLWGPSFDGNQKLVWAVADDNKLIRRSVVFPKHRSRLSWWK